MLAPKKTTLGNSARMRNGFNLLYQPLRMQSHALGLVMYDQASLHSGVMDRDTSRTSIFITLQRLDSAKRQHKSVSKDHQMSTSAHGPINPTRIG